jgi:hypothetical protein
MGDSSFILAKKGMEVNQKKRKEQATTIRQEEERSRLTNDGSRIQQDSERFHAE